MEEGEGEGGDEEMAIELSLLGSLKGASHYSS